MINCFYVARSIIGLVNFIILIVLGVVVFFIWSQLKQLRIDEVDSFKKQLLLMLIGFIFIAIASIVGFFMLCCGQYKCFRVFYIILYMIFIAIESALITLAIRNRDNSLKLTKTYFEDHIGESVIRNIESKLKCCGYGRPYNTTEQSMCGFQSENVPNIPLCHTKIDHHVERFTKIILILEFSIISAQILHLIFAFWYAFYFKDDSDEDI